MIKTKNKYYARRILFVLFAAISSFIVGIQRLLEFYHNYFYSIINLIFLCLGFGVAYFVLFFKPSIKYRSPNLIVLLFVVVNTIFFMVPFIGKDSFSFFFEHAVYICNFLVGFLITQLIFHFANLIDFRKKENYWTYLGFVFGAGVMLLAQIFLSSFESFFIVIILVATAGVVLSYKLGRKYLKIGIYSIISLVFFIVFDTFGWNNIKNAGKAVNRMGGIFSNQIQIGEEKASNIKSLGLSSVYSDMLPTYKNIYLDGDRYGEFVQSLPTSSYPNYTPYKVSYALGGKSRVLILNARGSNSVYIAHGITSTPIDVVEKNDPLLKIIRDSQSAYVGGIYHNRNTIFYRSSARSYVASSLKTYDVITIPFNTGYQGSQFLTQGTESLFSGEAILSYLDILNKNGIIHFSINSDTVPIKEAIVLNIIKTLFELYDSNKASILSHVKVFSSGDIISIMVFKDVITPLVSSQYTNLLNSLQFKDHLQDKNTQLSQYLYGILDNNKNILDKFSYTVKPRNDNDMYWIYQLGSLYNHRVQYFSDNIFDVLMMAGILLIIGVSFLYFTSLGLKDTVHSKIQLPGIVAYFLGSGLSIGILIIALAKYIYFIVQEELLPGSLFLASLIVSSTMGTLVFKVFSKRYHRIIISLAILVILIVLYSIILPSATYEYLISMSLMLRVVVVMMFLSLFFFFIFIPFASGSEWLHYFDNKSDILANAIFFFSLAVGLLIGFLGSFIVSHRILIFLSVVGILTSLVYFILMDRHYTRVNFLYRRSRY